MKLSHFAATICSCFILFKSFGNGAYFHGYTPLSSIIKLTQNTARSSAREPINYISLLEKPIIDTPNNQIDHLSHFTVGFGLHSPQRQQFKLKLEPNHDIIPDDAQTFFLNVHGHVKSIAAISRHAHKVFKGSAWLQEEHGGWEEVGWARIYVKRDGEKPLIEGAFSMFGDHHHIQLRSSYLQSRRESDVITSSPRYPEDEQMVVYWDSDIAQGELSGLDSRSSSGLSCGADQLDFNYEFSHPILGSRSGDFSPLSGPASSPERRQSGRIGNGNLQATIGSTAGCPIEGRVALIGVATDCTYTASFASTDAVRENIISMVNTASQVYERTFNITIGLRNLTISDEQCPTTASAATPWNIDCSGGDIEERLNLFSTWRASTGDGNAYWTLMSTCNSGTSVGLAWLGQICVSGEVGSSSQSVSGANVVVRTPSEWQVFA